MVNTSNVPHKQAYFVKTRNFEVQPDLISRYNSISIFCPAPTVILNKIKTKSCKVLNIFLPYFPQ